MDAITLIIILLSVLAGGGAGGAAWALAHQQQRRALDEGLKSERPHGGRYVSLFDVFWDLGASDVALEMMRHNNLLPTGGDDVDRAHRELEEVVDSFDGYAEFIEASLEAIREFYEARRTDSRRQIPTLETRGRKLLPMGEGEENGASISSSALVSRPRGASNGREGLGRLIDETLEERTEMRESQRPPDIRLAGTGRGDGVVDVDDVANFEPIDMLTSIFEGRFTDTLQSWWERRRLRGLKSDLDEQFEAFYDFYVDQVDNIPNFYDNLYATAEQWDREAERIDRLTRRKPLSGTDVGPAARILLETARRTARQIARQAERTTTEAIERIHAFAGQGDFAMAGYLLYLNQHAFFAGRSPDYADYVRRIENTAYRVKEEIRRLEQ
jgi:hypothetical protein